MPMKPKLRKPAKISEIDKDKIRKLEVQRSEKPSTSRCLIPIPRSINKSPRPKTQRQIALQDLQSQASGMKILVSLGRDDIRTKQAALTAAKKESFQSAKVRSILSEIESYKSKIKGDKSAISTPNKLMATEWKNFKAAVKTNESARTSDALSRR